MRVVRRISAAFKDIPGGQMLGATYDYTHRLIHFERENEDAGELHRLFQHILEEQIPAAPKAYHRVSDMLRAEGLMDRRMMSQKTCWNFLRPGVPVSRP